MSIYRTPWRRVWVRDYQKLLCLIAGSIGIVYFDLVLCSNTGVARTSPFLGHSMGTLRLYELPREVQKLMGRSGGHPPPENLQPPRSVLWPYTVAKGKSQQTRVWWAYDTRNSVLHIAILRCSISNRIAPDLQSTMLLSALQWWGTATSC